MSLLVDQLTAYDNEWKTGDRAKAKQMAVAMVDADPESFAGMEAMSLQDLVLEVGKARREGDGIRRILLDAWLLARHEPQNIGGVLNHG